MSETPVPQVLDALSEQPAGGRVWVRRRRTPFPLSDLARTLGCPWRTRCLDDPFQIPTWNNAAPPSRIVPDWSPGC